MIDSDAFFETVWNIISDEFETVLCLGWDGNAPGMSGALWINDWCSPSGKTLYFLTSSDLDPEGPFDSMEEAMGDYFNEGIPNPELSSDVLELERLKEIGLGLVADGDTIVIDGELFARQGEKLVSVEE